MKYKPTKGGEIEGHLDIYVTHNEEEFEGVISKWEEILIHGDPEGLRSFAKLLNDIADLNQEEVDDKDLPIGAREHYNLRPRLELANSSDIVVVGRLDAKGTGVFYDRFIPKDNSV
ncbi:MAG: hypothetical protein AB9834_02875 [Lentimicrobium sp.]